MMTTRKPRESLDLKRRMAFVRRQSLTVLSLQLPSGDCGHNDRPCSTLDGCPITRRIRFPLPGWADTTTHASSSHDPSSHLETRIRPASVTSFWPNRPSPRREREPRRNFRMHAPKLFDRWTR